MNYVTDWDNVPIMFEIEYATKLLGMKKRSIQRMAKENKIPAFKANGKWRFYKEDIKEWMKTTKK